MATITIGLDGANWNLISEWIEEGRLPTLGQLVDEGVGGTSLSCLPPLTVPNWKCYATGKNPGQLDVFRFDKIDTDSREHVFHDRTDFKSAELWDYMNKAGMKAGVINKPSTFPPREIDGFVIAGGPDASETEYRSLASNFATPEHVETFLKEELNYRVHPSPMISPAEKGRAEIEAIHDLISLRFEAADRLLEREDPDFLHLTIFYSMALQHYFWRDGPVREAWEIIDKELSRFVDDGHDIVIMSDHGTCYVDTVFYINVWLAEQGYLATERSLDTGLRSLGITRERALWLAKKFGMTSLLSRVVPEQIQKVLPWDEGVKRDRVLSVIDWEQTTAVASNQGPIYLNVDSDAEYERIRSRLIEDLSGLKHPKTAKKLVKTVERGEEHYSGKYAENAPDLILDQADGVHTSDAIGPDSWYDATGVWKGGNHPEGLFLMHGPSFADGDIDREATITDLAPTILHTMGVAVPEDMDGTVLDVFTDGSNPAEHPVTFQPSIREDGKQTDIKNDDVEERLADLGYLE
jgi:predicted AlkP superfamily phosphohydrolase/phosphomutase